MQLERKARSFGCREHNQMETVAFGGIGLPVVGTDRTTVTHELL